MFVQSERSETIIIPVSSLGNVSDTRKQILQNTLTDELKKHFRIVPQEKYEQVLEQVFEELEYEECSEDTCIMRVQEMLQVENVFHLQIIGEGKDSQLNLKWTTLDEKSNETDVCLGCGTFQLNDKVRGLVQKLVGEKPIVVKKKKGILFRDTPYTKFFEGGEKWIKFGDEETQVKFEGEIVDGVPNGEGTENFPNGQKYFGEFKDGLPNGQGMKTFPDGKKYMGEFKDGLKNGQGTFTYLDGEKYVGEFKDGLPNGHVTYTSPSGRKYVGEYKDGVMNGQGTFTYLDGEKYVGEFKDEEFHGKGTLTRPDGGKYVGEFKNGKIHGQGTYTFEKGKYEGFKYVGEWKDGTQQGQGTDSLPDGSNYVGEWKDGERWNGTLYDKEGKIIGKFMNGWFDQ